jgi:hypothetical protein
MVIPKGSRSRPGGAEDRSRPRAGDNRYIAAEPDGGVHPMIAFLEDGLYLYTGRATKWLWTSGSVTRVDCLPAGSPSAG